MNATHAEITKETRAIAKASGLTLQKSNAYINGKQAYHFTKRSTGETVVSNCTLGSAWETALSGHLEQFKD